jgi:pyruvate kinase
VIHTVGPNYSAGQTDRGLLTYCYRRALEVAYELRVTLEVSAVEGSEVHTRVSSPAPSATNKGLNLPGAAVSVPALSEKDRADLRFALRHGVDAIALSFVCSADDAAEVRRIMAEEGVVRPVIAKVEKPQANLAGIVRGFDAVMVAG